MLAALFFVACSERGETLVLTGSSTLAPVVEEAARRFEAENPGLRIEVQTGGSARGIADVRAGLADFGMVSRELGGGEGDLSAHPLAIDGVGFIVHRDNPVEGLSREEIVAVYTGAVSNWSELGGADAPILVASKAEGRATLEVFLAYTGLDSADLRPHLVVGENQHAIKTVVSDPTALAYVSIGAAAGEAAAGAPLKLLRCDGVDPVPERVASAEYPVSRPLLLVSKGTPPPLAARFLDFLGSPAVGEIVRSHRYVPRQP
jgi:phosphate transport system substrate-binding protein